MLQIGAVIASGVRRFVSDETGQDLIEYAILTGLVTLSSILIFMQLAVTMHDVYAGDGGWNEATQDAWEPCPPGGCGEVGP